MVGSIRVQAPHPLLVRVRDRFWPAYRFPLKTEIGLLPYDKNDLVASGLCRGTFEPEEQMIMRALLPSCRGMMDIGANLGLYTLLASRLIPRDGRIVAFEASPIEYSKLSWTIQRNRLSNVEAVAAAVSDECGTATIHQSLAGAGALNRLDRPAKTSGQWQEVQVPKTTLDAWAATHDDVAIDLIKVDVEGHEFAVLEGAKALLQRCRPIILIEVNAARASARSSPRQIWHHLVERNYRWFAVQEGDAQLRPATEPGASVNYLAIPSGPSANPALEAAVSTLLR